MPVQRKVTKEIAAAMFKLYEQDMPIKQIVRTLAISEPTVVRIKKRDRWDERIEAKRKKAQQIADNRSAYSMANQLVEVNTFLAGIVNSIIREAQHPRPCPNCSGSGLVANASCGACTGTGKVTGLHGDLKEYRELVKSKIELLDMVTPEIPVDTPEPTNQKVDRVAAVLDKLEEAAKINLEDLGDVIADDIIKQRSDQSK